jgi:mannitol/fructose-specific phosphotransferase system IIA component (Ntr-type)
MSADAPLRVPTGSDPDKPLVLLDVPVDDLHDALPLVVDAMAERWELDARQRHTLAAALRRHTEAGPTVLDTPVAIIHQRLRSSGPPMAVLVRLAAPDPGSESGEPQVDLVRFAWVLVSNEVTHPRIGLAAEFARLMHEPVFAEMAEAAPTPDALLRLYDEAVSRKAGLRDLPPGLRRSGRLGGGLAEDFRRRAPWWRDDFRAGLNVKSLASILFMFFACLAPAVAFGGLAAQLTGGQIGAVEMLLASAVGGVFWALCAGQPLAIVGATGPNVIFTGILYALTQRYGVPFLPTAAWTGLWAMLFMWALAVTDASVLIRFFTRFTDEIFAALISAIFVVEAFQDIAGAFSDPSVANDTALLTLVLALGTFSVAYMLSRLRRSPYLLGSVREFLSDFGPTIAIAAMTLVAFQLHDVHLTSLPVPAELAPSVPRAWLVNPFDAPRWVWFASALPALLLTILVWFNQNITARLINSPENQLLKGPAYHWDIAVMGTLLGALSLFGLPWVVGAVVRSLNHVRSLTDERPNGTRVTLENRVTNLGIHALMGASLLFLPLLAHIPMAVLFGVFLFMGVGSLGGNQFVDRLRLWLMDPERYPTNHYLRAVPKRVVHGFTAIQALCFAMLWVVKSSIIGISFPFFVALLVPVRMLLGRAFNPEHVALLDGDELPADEEFREVGV